MLSIKVDNETILKILEDSDAEELYRLVNKNRVYLREWLPWLDNNRTIEDSKFFIKTATDQYEQNLGFQCGIRFCDKLVGIIGYQRIDWMNQNVEIGYWLDADYQGRGIITKACREMINYAFYEYELHRVQIRCAVGNIKSCSVIKRLGFINEGIIRQAEFLYDHYVDLNIYGIISNEWNARNSTDSNKVKLI